MLISYARRLEVVLRKVVLRKVVLRKVVLRCIGAAHHVAIRCIQGTGNGGSCLASVERGGERALWIACFFHFPREGAREAVKLEIYPGFL